MGSRPWTRRLRKRSGLRSTNWGIPYTSSCSPNSPVPQYPAEVVMHVRVLLQITAEDGTLGEVKEVVASKKKRSARSRSAFLLPREKPCSLPSSSRSSGRRWRPGLRRGAPATSARHARRAKATIHSSSEPSMGMCPFKVHGCIGVLARPASHRLPARHYGSSCPITSPQRDCT